MPLSPTSVSAPPATLPQQGLEPLSETRLRSIEYAGFWIRVVATLIDTVFLCFLMLPFLMAMPQGDSVFSALISLAKNPDPLALEAWLFSLLQQPAVPVVETSLWMDLWDVFVSWILPAGVVMLFWFYKFATPGKMLLGLKIVDVTTGRNPSKLQLVGRYLAYFVAMLPLCLGLVWVAFDARKQGLHDKLAGTLVVRGWVVKTRG